MSVLFALGAIDSVLLLVFLTGVMVIGCLMLALTALTPPDGGDRPVAGREGSSRAGAAGRFAIDQIVKRLRR